MRFTIWLIAVAIVLVSMLSIHSLKAQGGEIRIISQEVVSKFPDGVTFKVSATGPDPIEDIRVFFKTEGSGTTTYGRLNVEEPAKQVTGEYFLSTTGARHIPPGTNINYSYEIRDQAGRVLRTEEKQATYMDSRFQWSQVSQGLITVYYSGEFVEKRAREILAAAVQTEKNMSPVLGIKLEKPIRIVAYNNYRSMAAALPFRSQIVREELQTEGQAWPEHRVTLVLAISENIIGITSHEFTHILTADAAGPAYPRVPAWLNEGLSEYANLDPGIAYERALNYAIFTRRLKPLWHLGDFGGDPTDIIIGYGVGRSVVTFIIERYGKEKMAALMKALQQTTSIDEALKRVYGFDQHGLDSEWRKSIGLEPLPAPQELARQLAATPTPTPQPAPTPLPEPTPTPKEESKPTPKEKRKTTIGCTIQRSKDRTQLPLDVMMLALIGGPAALFSLRKFNKHK